MSLPGVLYGFLIASAVGLAFHLVRGGNLTRLVVYLVTAWISFALGDTVGGWIGLHVWRFGSLNVFAGLVGTLFGLATAAFLAGPDQPPAAGRDDSPSSRDRRA